MPLHRTFALGPDGRVQGRITTGHAAVHGRHFGFRHAKVVGNTGHVFGAQIAFFQCANAVFGFAQVEKQLLLRGCRTELHHRPAAQDVFLNGRADPPHRVGRKAEALFRVKTFHGLHQPDVGFGNHFGLWQPVAAIAHGNFGGQSQVRRHHFVRRVGVLMVHPAFGQHIFFVRFQHRELADVLHVAVQALFRRRGRQICIR